MYYPEALIVTDQYTQGGEYTDTSGKSYIGFYWKTYTGAAYTGRNPQDPQGGRPLTRYSVQQEQVPTDLPTLNTELSEMASEYDTLRQVPSNLVNIPYSLIKPPTTDDYIVGQFTRYFCKRTNAELYIEIDNQQFTKLTSRSEDILWQLYTPFSMFWKLTGDREQVYTVNKNLTDQVINKRRYFKFADFLKNQYLLYYKG